VAHLRSLGYRVLDPDEGDLAAGEGAGPGRMPEPETILAHAARLLEAPTLAGRRFVVSAGPTREPVDPVRYLSNHSSGRMGVEVAAAAWRRGAEVTLVAGPLTVPLPVGPSLVHVETTMEMRDAVATALVGADALVMAAAPADFRVAAPAAQKIKKEGGAPMMQLAENPDILKSTIGNRTPGTVVVGFALETQDVVGQALAKIA
jgi:phosphopantothenoylcysteine decarboxylase/phosphopantothenate--cysteine ligase